MACLEAGFLYWYVGVFIAFTTLTGGTETVLTERPDKITLNTLQRTLNSAFTKMSHGSFTDCMAYRNMDTFIPSTNRDDRAWWQRLEAELVPCTFQHITSTNFLLQRKFKTPLDLKVTDSSCK